MTDINVAMRAMVVERVIPHPPVKIWRALTRSPLIREWLMKNDFQPVVGHRFNSRATPIHGWNGETDCEVLEVPRTNAWPIAGMLRESRRWVA